MKKVLSVFALSQYFMVVMISTATNFGVLHFLKWWYSNEQERKIMLEIFIPVLFICMNGHCEFLQTQTSYKAEVQCWESINKKRCVCLRQQKKLIKGKFPPQRAAIYLHGQKIRKAVLKLGSSSILFLSSFSVWDSLILKNCKLSIPLIRAYQNGSHWAGWG